MRGFGILIRCTNIFSQFHPKTFCPICPFTCQLGWGDFCFCFSFYCNFLINNLYRVIIQSYSFGMFLWESLSHLQTALTCLTAPLKRKESKKIKEAKGGLVSLTFWKYFYVYITNLRRERGEIAGDTRIRRGHVGSTL